MRTQDNDGPEIRLDDAFMKGAAVKEKSARERQKEWERAGLAPRRRRFRIGGLGLRHWGIPALFVLAVAWPALGLPTPFGEDDTASSRTQQTAQAGVAAPGDTTTTTFALEGRIYQPGQCVQWDQTEERKGTRVTHVVPCDQPHLIEMTGRHRMALVGAYPTEAEWDEIIHNGECQRLAKEYLGSEIDPYGRFVSGALRPLPESWNYGYRDLWCGVQASGRGQSYQPDVLVEFTGAVRSQPQTFVLEARTCMATDPVTKDVTGPGPCTGPHAYEIVGPLDVGARFKTRPSDAQLVTGRLADDCDRLAKAAFGGRLPAGVRSTIFPIEEASWRTGRRTTECGIARYDAANNPVVVTAPLLPAP